MRKVVPAGAPRPQQVLARLNEGTLTAAPRAARPTGQISLDDAAGSIVPAVAAGMAARPAAQRHARDRSSRSPSCSRSLLAIARRQIGLALLGVALARRLGRRAPSRGACRKRETLREAFQEKSFTPAAVDQDRAAAELRAHRIRRRHARRRRRRPAATAPKRPTSASRSRMRSTCTSRPRLPPPIPQPLQLDNAVVEVEAGAQSGRQRSRGARSSC